MARGRNVVARWCDLAERRLEYLTELFETGRWRRYHSELALLENIQEAKRAVEIWRDLSTREASRDNSSVDASWLGRTRATLSRGDALRNQVGWLPPPLTKTPAEPLPSVVSMSAEKERVASDAAHPAPDPDAPGPILSIDAIEQRYPLLRNAL